MRKSGGPPPLPGQPGYKVSETDQLEREAKDMEVRLQMLQERMQQQNLDDAAVSKGGSRWRSARPDKGSVTAYAKDVQERIKRRASEGPPVSSAAAASSDAKGPLPSRRPSRPTQQQLQHPQGDDFRSKDIDAWTVADVRDWLHAVLLGQYAPLFEGNEINGPILLEITLEDLDYMGMTILGHRKVLLRGIEDLRKNRRVTISLAAAPPSGSSAQQYQQQQQQLQQQDTRLTSQSLESLRAPLQRPLHEPAQSVHWSQLEPLASNKVSSLGAAPANAADGDLLDEAAERAAFAEAVMDWRKGGGRVKIEREGDFPDSASGAGAKVGGGGLWHNPFGPPGDGEESDLLGGGAGSSSSSSSSSKSAAKLYPASSSSSSYLRDGGLLDEAAEREEFKRAVEEWRGGGGGSKGGGSVGLGAGGGAGAGRTLADKLARELESEQALISLSLQRQREEATRRLDAANRGLEEARRSRMQAHDEEKHNHDGGDEDIHDDEDDVGEPSFRRPLSTNPSLDADAFTPPLSPHLSDDEDLGIAAEDKDGCDRAQSKVTLALVETSMGSDFGEDKGGYVVEEASDED